MQQRKAPYLPLGGRRDFTEDQKFDTARKVELSLRSDAMKPASRPFSSTSLNVGKFGPDLVSEWPALTVPDRPVIRPTLHVTNRSNNSCRPAGKNLAQLAATRVGPPLIDRIRLFADIETAPFRQFDDRSPGDAGQDRACKGWCD